jgi:hypothetical protein
MFGVLMLFIIFTRSPLFRGNSDNSAELEGTENDSLRRKALPPSTPKWKLFLFLCIFWDLIFVLGLMGLGYGCLQYGLMRKATKFVPGRTTELHVTQIGWSDSYANGIGQVYCEDNPIYCGNCPLQSVE